MLFDGTPNIRDSSHIAGISVGPTTHKISLYADDVIIIVTDPENSLKATYDILQSFAQVAYYKLNETKSLIIGLNIPSSSKLRIQKDFLFAWTHESLPYLGIQLPAKVSLLYNNNYKLFIDTLPHSLNQLKTKEITTSGRIATFKMLILPKL